MATHSPASSSTPEPPTVSLVARTRHIVSFLTGAVLPLLLINCAALPAPPPDSEVRYVRIEERVTPRDLYVYVGEEVRWQNLRPTPIKIGLLGNKVFDRTTCAQGFTRLGRLEDFVTIEPGEYVSLCFSKTGIIRYNIWLEPANPRGPISRTGRVHVDGPL